MAAAGVSVLLGLLVLGAGWFPAVPAKAADWVITPQVKMEGQYDSNINFSFTRRKHDFILNMSPAVDLTYASEVSRLTGRAALTGLVYLRDSRLDTLNQYYSVLAEHKVAPRLALTFDGGYTLDSTLTEELTAAGYVMNRTRREAWRAAPGLAFYLTERAILKGGYSYAQTDYQDPRYNDYHQHTGTLALHYLLKNAKTTVIGVVLGRLVNYPTIDNLYRNLGTYAGLEHKFTEDWTLSLSAGANYNWFTSQTAVLDLELFPLIRIKQQKEETFSVTPYFNIEGKRRWERASLTFGYKLDQSASAGGYILEYHGVYAGFSLNITERLSTGLRGNLYYSTASSPRTSYENLVFYISPEVSYKLTEKLAANTGYRYGWREDFINPRTTDRHFVWVNLSYTYPMHFQK